MYSISFANSFILPTHSATPDTALGPLQHSAITGWTGRQNPNLVQTRIPSLCFFPAFPTTHGPAWEGIISSGNSTPTELQSYQEILAPEYPLYPETVSNYLVTSRLGFLLLLIVRARKCKVRAGQHECKAMAGNSSLMGTVIIWNSFRK